jgi:hypothetical protein
MYLSLLRDSEGAGFTDRDLFDWTGNHFDPDALVLRIGTALAAGAIYQRHTYLDPPAILGGYDVLKRRVAADQTAVQRQPVPIDLLSAFRHASDAAAAASGVGRSPTTGPRMERGDLPGAAHAADDDEL